MQYLTILAMIATSSIALAAPAPVTTGTASVKQSATEVKPAKTVSSSTNPTPGPMRFAFEAGSTAAVDHPELNVSDQSWILPVINGFDKLYNVPLKTWNATLRNNAYKTIQAGHGRDQVHHLYPGTWGQVLCPGRFTKKPTAPSPFNPFELVYFGWLCEKSTDPQLAGKCKTAQQYNSISQVAGQTGHHDILTSHTYTQIGCAFIQNDQQKNPDSPFQGIWGCDLA